MIIMTIIPDTLCFILWLHTGIKIKRIILTLIILTGGTVPYDGSPVDAVDHTHAALTVIYCLLGILGLIFAVACLIFNSLFKNKR